MNLIFSTFIVILIILMFSIFAAWLDRFGWKDKEEFINESIEKVSDIVSGKMAIVWDKCKQNPWYLVVYTQDSNYPIWISNNTIRSVHPDPEICRITVKQFNGEDMMIENVISYELCSANEMCDYDM